MKVQTKPGVGIVYGIISPIAICVAVVTASLRYPQWFKTLNTYGSAISALAAAASVVVAIVFGWASFIQARVAKEALEEARQQRREAYRPVIVPVAGVAPGRDRTLGVTENGVFQAVGLMNVGPGPAMDTRVTLCDISRRKVTMVLVGAVAPSATSVSVQPVKINELTPLIEEMLRTSWRGRLSDPAYEIEDDDDGVVFEATYTDVLGRRFITMAAWGAFGWEMIGTGEDRKPTVVIF